MKTQREEPIRLMSACRLVTELWEESRGCKQQSTALYSGAHVRIAATTAFSICSFPCKNFQANNTWKFSLSYVTEMKNLSFEMWEKCIFFMLTLPQN